jgi:carbonic anhydrase
MSRRDFGKVAGLAVGVKAIFQPARLAADETPAKRDPDAVLAQLFAGNTRFVKGASIHPLRRPENFAALAEGQAPLAVIVGCADSRVPPEVVFDQGIGDLFVVRIAGNIISGAGASVKGSIEYAVAELGVRLVMVLGHSNCGAVKAALKHIDAKDALAGSIGELVNTIKPAVTAVQGQSGNILHNVIKANVERGVDRLKGLEPILAGPVKKGVVKIVGATYDLRTGEVTAVS